MLNELKNALNVTHTENGAVVHKTSFSGLVDFFSLGGSLRTRTEQEIYHLFSNAFAEDPLLAMKTLFYFRDIREGQGERRTFRVIINQLAKLHPEVVAKNVHLIGEYGRWDDIYSLLGTSPIVEDKLKEVIRKQFKEDMDTEYPSLLGKWLSSANSKIKQTRKEGLWTAKALGLTEKDYRKSLSSLREKLNVVETLMTSKQWSEIDYAKVPSKAMLVYRNAFARNDEERYTAYLESLKTGETKVNAGAIYPYELVRTIDKELDNKLCSIYYNGYSRISSDKAALYDAMWNALPDFTEGREENSLSVVDVSGSMTVNEALPLYTAISLGLYVSERANGPFKNHFMTFSNHPELVEVQGETIVDKVFNMSRANWNNSTNIESVFNIILDTAIHNHLSNEEMINRLYIITDMEFNCLQGSNETLFKAMKKKYESNGYKLPELVFMNVAARNTHTPMTVNDYGVVMVSGMSPSIFKSLMSGKITTPYEMLVQTVDVPRYEAVTI